MTIDPTPRHTDADKVPTTTRRTPWLILAALVTVLLCTLATTLLIRTVLPARRAGPTQARSSSAPMADRVGEAAGALSDAPHCKHGAEYVGDATIPDGTVAGPGETLLKAWRVRNSGTCPWTESTVLRFANGTQMSNVSDLGIPTADPGEVIEITLTLTAPSEPGRYRGDWQLCADDDTCFGPHLYAEILVDATVEPQARRDVIAAAVPDTTTDGAIAFTMPDLTAEPTYTPTSPDAGASAWLIAGGRRLGVREIDWDTHLNGFVVDEGSVFLSLFIVAETTGEAGATFSGLEINLIDGEGETHTTLILERKDPPFGLCVAEPGEPCEGWWSTLLPDRESVRDELVLSWEPRLFAPRLETPIRTDP